MLGRKHHFRDNPLPTPFPLSLLDFPRNKMVTFLLTLNMGVGRGGGGAQEHGISQIVQPIVRIIELGVT